MILIGNSPANILQWVAVPVRTFEMWAFWNDDENDDDVINDDNDKVQEGIRKGRPHCHWEANLRRGTAGKGGGDEDGDGDVVISGLVHWGQWEWTDETSQWQVGFKWRCYNVLFFLIVIIILSQLAVDRSRQLWTKNVWHSKCSWGDLISVSSSFPSWLL